MNNPDAARLRQAEVPNKTVKAGNGVACAYRESGARESS
jgi:hypothetical protein